MAVCNMRTKRIWILEMVVGSLAVMVGGFLLYCRFEIIAPPKIVVAPDTTLLTSPLRPDGAVDYFEALNRSFGRGVTPENNAFVALLPAIGTGPEMLGEAHAEIVKLVGGVETRG